MSHGTSTRNNLLIKQFNPLLLIHSLIHSEVLLCTVLVLHIATRSYFLLWHMLLAYLQHSDSKYKMNYNPSVLPQFLKNNKIIIWFLSQLLRIDTYQSNLSQGDKNNIREWMLLFIMALYGQMNKSLKP